MYYCRRARDKGWKVVHLPEARVIHLRGGSGSVEPNIAVRKRLRPYFYASRSRYVAKSHGRTRLWVSNLFCSA